MPGSVFDSALLGGLFDPGDVARLFSDTAELRAMMLVEAALAQAQAAQGTIPADAAAAIQRASLEAQLDPTALAEATAQNGVATPAFVAAFRAAIPDKSHGNYLHWGATSQDIQDTALMLRLRQAVTRCADDLTSTLKGLAHLAETHAETPMAARTYGQHATPTSFGAVVATWGWPFLTLLQDVPALRKATLLVSLSGAAGTASALGGDPAALRADMANALGLGDPGRSWHNDRTPVLRLADWFTRCALAAGKLGEDLLLATQSGISEVTLGASGSSSTMPQKQNPVAPSALVALARHVQGLNATLQGTALHRQQRDGATWFTEWMTVPPLVLGTASALRHATRLAEVIAPAPHTMRNTLDATGGLLMAEALSFALAQDMPRPDAQAAVKTLCKTARETDQPLEQLVRTSHPELPASLFDPAHQLGTAPNEAHAFVQAVREAS